MGMFESFIVSFGGQWLALVPAVSDRSWHSKISVNSESGNLSKQFGNLNMCFYGESKISVNSESGNLSKLFGNLNMCLLAESKISVNSESVYLENWTKSVKNLGQLRTGSLDEQFSKTEYKDKFRDVNIWQQRKFHRVRVKQARKLQATPVRNYHRLADGGEV